MRKDPSQELVREMFCYCPSTGVITRRKNSSNAKAGEIAGYVGNNGYRLIWVITGMFGAHRIAWIYVNGDIPPGMEIDHVNGIKHDNRIDNLRLATRTQNSTFRRMHKNNKSGFKGVCAASGRGAKKRWRARIVVNKVRIELGRFDSPEEAHEAYKKEAIKHFGEFSKF